MAATGPPSIPPTVNLSANLHDMTQRHPQTGPSRSSHLFQAARQIMPGGLSRNTLFRLPNPDYAAFGKGCHVTDIDGQSRADLANNMASLIHGHAHPQIVAAVTDQLQRGSAFTMATEAEYRLAQLLCQRVPWFDKIRFMNSGTEAVMAAIKAARAITGRPGIAKAEGTYHGTYDYAEISQNATPDQWGDPQCPASVPVARGTPASVLQDVVVFPFNSTETTLALLDRHAARLACVLIDLVPHRAGLIPATGEFVSALRDWCNDHGVLLVFDEVITFRMDHAGAAEWYDVQPDLTTLGKIIGGGFPVGALAGREDCMAVLDPSRKDLPFPWSGTFSANPVSMTAGRVALELFDAAAIQQINQLGDWLRQEITEVIEQLAVPASVTGAGSMFRIHPKATPPCEYRTAWQNPEERRQTETLVRYLYDHGFMLFRTATGALSTATGKSELQPFVDTLRAGLAVVFDR
jgi:glutamate-1-semialdehyde 2,1-aminomutase